MTEDNEHTYNEDDYEQIDDEEEENNTIQSITPNQEYVCEYIYVYVS